MTNEQYIEHEVELRVLKEITSEKFQNHEKRMDRMDSKLNWLIGLIIGSLLMPVVLHLLKLT